MLKIESAERSIGVELLIEKKIARRVWESMNGGRVGGIACYWLGDRLGDIFLL